MLYLFVTWPVLPSYEKPLIVTCSKQFMKLPRFFLLDCEVNVHLA